MMGKRNYSARVRSIYLNWCVRKQACGINIERWSRFIKIKYCNRCFALKNLFLVRITLPAMEASAWEERAFIQLFHHPSLSFLYILLLFSSHTYRKFFASKREEITIIKIALSSHHKYYFSLSLSFTFPDEGCAHFYHRRNHHHHYDNIANIQP